jgi:hypothetical protein
VAGVIENEDVDYFAVKVEAGGRLAVEIEAMRLGGQMFDPYLAILDSRRFEQAVSDDTPLLLQDGIAVITAKEAATYIVQVRDSAYGGNGQCHYRLHVGTFPRPLAAYPAGGPPGTKLEVSLVGDADVPAKASVELPSGSGDWYRYFAVDADRIAPSPLPLRIAAMPNALEAEPNEGREAATASTAMPIAINGILGRAGDVDWFRIQAAKGACSFTLYGRRIGSPVDAVVDLFDAAGKRLAGNDDAGGPDSVFEFAIPADGEYLVRVRDHLGQGGPTYVYRLEVQPRSPSLSLSIPRFGRDSQARQAIAVPQGHRCATMIQASRQHLGGDLTIEAAGLPAGVRLHTVAMPGSVAQVPLVFEAAADAPLSGGLADLMARSSGGAGITGRFGHQVELVVASPNQTCYYQTQVDRLAVAVTEPAPFSLSIEEPKTPLVQFGVAALKVRVARREGFAGPVTLRMLWNPPGIGSSNTVTIARDAGEGDYPLNAAGNAAVGSWPIAILGEADAGKGQVLASTQLVQLQVAPPLVNLTIPLTVISRGGQGDVVCTIEPKQPFEGQANVILMGLPHKVTAPAQKIGPDAREVVFPVQVAQDSPLGRHKSLFCRVEVPTPQGVVVHHLGAGGTLRVDPPPPPKPAQPPVAAAPSPPEIKPADPAPAAPPAKRLSRLEQLRLQAREMAP